MLPVQTSTNPPINAHNTQTPVPERLEIHHTDPLHTDVMTDNAALGVLQQPQPDHQPRPLSSHVIKETPVQIFKGEIQTEHTKKEAELKEFNKEYKNAVRTAKIQKIALLILGTVVVLGCIAAMGAACAFCPPAGVAVAIAVGVTVAYTASLVLGSIAVTSLEDLDIPEDQRETLEKNVNNLNGALELFESHPKKIPADNSSFEEFLATMPAITQNGERVYELQHLDKYVSLFHKNQKLRTFDNYDSISAQLNAKINEVKDELRSLGVIDPVDTTSIRNKIKELAEEVETPNENDETINRLQELANKLSGLIAKQTELETLYINGRDVLEEDMKPDREAIEKAVAEKQKQGATEEIDNLNKELKATKETFIAQSRNSPPINELPEKITQKEQDLQKAQNDILQLEGSIRGLATADDPQLPQLNLQLTELIAARDKLTNEITTFKSIIENKNKIEAIKNKLITLKAAKQVQEANNPVNQQNAVNNNNNASNNSAAQVQSDINAPKPNVQAANSQLDLWKSMAIPLVAPVRVEDLRKSQSIGIFGSRNKSTKYGELSATDLRNLGRDENNNFLSNAYPQEGFIVEGKPYSSVIHYMLSKRIDHEITALAAFKNELQDQRKVDELQEVIDRLNGMKVRIADLKPLEAYNTLDEWFLKHYKDWKGNEGVFSRMDADLKTALWSKFIGLDGKPTAEGLKLIATGDKALYAGYELGDAGYGMELDEGRGVLAGENKLGVCLMQLRSHLVRITVQGVQGAQASQGNAK